MPGSQEADCPGLYMQRGKTLASWGGLPGTWPCSSQYEPSPKRKPSLRGPIESAGRAGEEPWRWLLRCKAAAVSARGGCSAQCWEASPPLAMRSSLFYLCTFQ